MANVIDALVVTAGLDVTDFLKGEKDIDAALKRLREKSGKLGVDLQGGTKQAGEAFSKLRNQAIAFFAVMTAGRGLKSLFSEINAGDAAAGRFAHNIGIATDELQAFEGAAKRTGGTAGGLDATLQSLTSAGQEFILTGRSGVIPYLNQLGISLTDAQGKLKPATQLLRDLNGSDRLKALPRTTAMSVLSSLGLDPGTANLVLSSQTEFNNNLDAARRAGVASNADAGRAQQLQNSVTNLQDSFKGLVRTVENSVTPALTRLFDWLAGVLQKYGPRIATEITARVEKFVSFLMAVDWPKIGEKIGDVVQQADHLAQGIGGITRAAEILFGLWAGSKFLTMLSNITLLAGALTPVGLALAELGAIKAADALVGDVGTQDDVKGGHRTALGRWIYENFSSLRYADNYLHGEGDARSDRPSSDEQDKLANQSIDTLVKLGWTKAAAIGAAANLKQESGFNTKAVGDNGLGIGVAQWHPERRKAIEDHFKKRIQDMTLDEQLSALDWEVRKDYQSTFKYIQSNPDAKMNAGVISQDVERPYDTDVEMRRRAGLADAIERKYGSSTAMSARPGMSTSTSTSETHINGPITVNTKATDAKGIAADMRAALTRRQNVSLANTGLA